nr:hypothetical protein LTR18_004204 [Exophiala xenobiotica]
MTKNSIGNVRHLRDYDLHTNIGDYPSGLETFLRWISRNNLNFSDEVFSAGHRVPGQAIHQKQEPLAMSASELRRGAHTTTNLSSAAVRGNSEADESVGAAWPFSLISPFRERRTGRAESLLEVDAALWLDQQPASNRSYTVPQHTQDPVPEEATLNTDAPDTASPHPSPTSPSDAVLERDFTDGGSFLPVDMPPTSHDLVENAGTSSLTDEQLCTMEMQLGLDIWSSVHEFFNTMYIIFPILSYTDVASRLIETPDWFAVPDFRTLLLSLQLLNACGKFRMDSKDERFFRHLINQVEASRQDHDFADPATLDAVVCSLFLFTAYNVLEKHGRAFLYLDEAVSLLEAALPYDERGKQRKLRLQQVLFNTEAATLKIYGSASRSRRVRRPPLDVEIASATEDGVMTGLDSVKIAAHLLRRLTEINLAEDAVALQSIDVESEADVEILCGNVLRQHRYSRIQAADVVLTRQWQLSSKILATRSCGLSLEQPPWSAIEHLGHVAMAWVCVLREGELRIVGLGKLAGLAHNLYNLAGPLRCRFVLGGLAGAVGKEDHDKRYAPALAKILFPIMSAIPTVIKARNDHESYQSMPSAQFETHTVQEILEPSWNPQSQAEMNSDAGLRDEGLTNDREEAEFEQFIDLS